MCAMEERRNVPRWGEHRSLCSEHLQHCVRDCGVSVLPERGRVRGKDLLGVGVFLINHPVLLLTVLDS